MAESLGNTRLVILGYTPARIEMNAAPTCGVTGRPVVIGPKHGPSFAHSRGRAVCGPAAPPGEPRISCPERDEKDSELVSSKDPYPHKGSPYAHKDP